MGNKAKKFILALTIFTIVSLGLGKFFDTRCPSRSCIGEAWAVGSGDGAKIWKRFNIIINDDNTHISFNPDGYLDDDDDHGANITIGEGELGGDEDNPSRIKTAFKDSYAAKDVKRINIKSYITDWKISASPDDKITFVFKGYLLPNEWAVKQSPDGLKLDVGKKGPLKGELLLPKDFNGTLLMANNAGDIEVENIGNTKSVIMQNVSGSVKFMAAPLNTLTLNTVNGDIEIDPLTVSKDLEIDVNSVSADLEASLKTSIKSFKANSVSGDVTLKVTKAVGFNFEMEGVSPSFDGLPKDRIEIDNIAHREAKGSFGSDPKGALNFNTVSGDFHLETAD